MTCQEIEDIRPKQVVDLNKIECTNKLIGKGGFAKVYQAIDKDTKEYYAAKFIKLNLKEASQDQMLSLYHELNIMSKLDHPYVLKFIGYSPVDYKNRKKPIIFTEFIKNGSLRDLIENERHSQAPHEYTNLKKFQIIYGIASGMLYLHQNNLIHRDLKPENILIDDEYLPKISDFGLAKEKHSKRNPLLQSKADIKGTYLYIAPEIWATKQYDKPCDVYAFSLIVYEILTSKHPFNDKMTIVSLFVDIVVNNERPTFDSSVPDSYRKLLEKCWSYDPSERPTFEEIVKTLKEDESFIIDEDDRDEIKGFFEDVDMMKSSYRRKQKLVKLKEVVKKDSKVFKIVAAEDDDQTDSDYTEEDEKEKEKEKIDFSIVKQLNDDGSAVSSLILSFYYFFMMFFSFFKMSKSIFYSIKKSINGEKIEKTQNEEPINDNENEGRKSKLVPKIYRNESESSDDDDEPQVVTVDYVADESPIQEDENMQNKSIVAADQQQSVQEDHSSENKESIIDENQQQNSQEGTSNENKESIIDDNQQQDTQEDTSNESKTKIVEEQDSNESKESIIDDNQQANPQANDNTTENVSSDSTAQNQQQQQQQQQQNQENQQQQQQQPTYNYFMYNYYNFYHKNRSYEYPYFMTYYEEIYKQIQNHPAVEGRQRAILVSTGAYCPVHEGHLKLLDTASTFLANEYNIDSILGIVSPSCDDYTYSRFNNETFPVRHRFECLKLACNEHNKKSDLVIVPDFWEASFVCFLDFPKVHYHFMTEINEMFFNENLLVLYVCGADLFVKANFEKKFYVAIARPGLKIDTPTDLQNHIYICNDKKYTGFYYDATMAISLARRKGEKITGLTYESVEKYLKDVIHWI